MLTIQDHKRCVQVFVVIHCIGLAYRSHGGSAIAGSLATFAGRSARRCPPSISRSAAWPSMPEGGEQRAAKLRETPGVERAWALFESKRAQRPATWCAKALLLSRTSSYRRLEGTGNPRSHHRSAYRGMNHACVPAHIRRATHKRAPRHPHCRSRRNDAYASPAFENHHRSNAKHDILRPLGSTSAALTDPECTHESMQEQACVPDQIGSTADRFGAGPTLRHKRTLCFASENDIGAELAPGSTLRDAKK